MASSCGKQKFTVTAIRVEAYLKDLQRTEGQGRESHRKGQQRVCEWALLLIPKMQRRWMREGLDKNVGETGKEEDGGVRTARRRDQKEDGTTVGVSKRIQKMGKFMA